MKSAFSRQILRRNELARSAGSCRGICSGGVVRPEASRTHDVFNQSTDLGNINVFSQDPVFKEAAKALGADWATEKFARYGEVCGTEDRRESAREANINPPTHEMINKFGNRVDRVKFHPSYHTLMESAINHEVTSFAWKHEGKEGAHVGRSLLGMDHYKTEGGTSCPLTMTFACLPALRHEPKVAEELMPKLVSDVYDPRDVPMEEKKGITLGMSMTEKQGGTDVRQNTTVARRLDDAEEQYELTGHKWFTSAPMCDAFLTLAQLDEGVTCFLVPRWLPDGSRNSNFRIVRLKDKMGDRSNASSEVEYDRAWARRIGPKGRGVQTIVDMVVHTRLDCGTGSSSLMRQAFFMTLNHSLNRKVFGTTLIDAPAMRALMADLAVESEASTWLALFTSSLFDRCSMDNAEESANPLRRLVTAVQKFWICKKAPGFAYECMESVGGNGYVHEWDFPRIFQQSPLNSIWEGSGNTIVLDILRTLAKEPESARSLYAELSKVQGQSQRYDAALASVFDQLQSLQKQDPNDVQLHGRFAVDALAQQLEAYVLRRYAPPEVADWYEMNHLEVSTGCKRNYGSLPVGFPTDSLHRIIDRNVNALLNK